MSERICSEPDCEGRHRARGLCSKHYQRWRAHGEPKAPDPVKPFLIIDGRRVCSRCLVDKPIEEFHRNTANPTGRYPWCKQCKSASARAYYVANSKKVKAAQLVKNRKARYGITRDQYEALQSQQEGLCAICGDGPQAGGRDFLGVDHDHACCPGQTRGCGKCIRGLLCTRCNTMLGMANDNIDRLLAAVEYLRRWVPSQAPGAGLETACSTSQKEPSTSTRTRSKSC